MSGGTAATGPAERRGRTRLVQRLGVPAILTLAAFLSMMAYQPIGAVACGSCAVAAWILSRRADPTAPTPAQLDGDARHDQRHGSTALPTREPLLAAIDQAGSGTLGIVAFADFDRLCAFDENLADDAMRVLVERLRRMIGSRRLLAHVDRAHLAIWFGDGSRPDEARRELAAMAYALGDVVAAGPTDTGWTPEVRTACVDLPNDAATAPALLTRAIALVNVAASGNTVGAIAGHDGLSAARELYALEQDLRGAIDRRQFAMVYQPIVDAAAGSVVGAEALLRWSHPTRGAVPPARFIPLVEACGLAGDVGLWTLNTACREAARWQQARLGPMSVAVNMSGKQIDRADVRASIERTLARHALAPGCLEIELTESVAAANLAEAVELFASLRTMGIGVSIDDFGTGYSSLSALRRLAFDKIKIDREFVTDVDQRSDSQAICLSVIALARGLGIRVLAEGVERGEEYRWLMANGCRLFQGYYFARPLGGDAFVAFARDSAGLADKLATGARAAQRRIRERLRA